MMNSYAHSLPGDPNVDHWEPMSDHEQRVAELCESFLARIDSDFGPWGNLLGRWHDLGKYSEAFQAYLRRESSNNEDIHRSDLSGKIDHSTAAAQFAVEREHRYGKLLAYIFAGHHAGLPDWDIGSGHSGLKQRLEKRIHPWQFDSAKEVSACSVPQLPKFASVKTCETIDRNMIAAFRVSFWVRLLFSALVDADFLATESFMSPLQTTSRLKSSVMLTNLAHYLENHLSNMQKTVEQSAVNDVRKEVSDACRAAAKLPPGLFALNVPTGGGKTLASLRFALSHADANNLDGVIVAIPFTSIIEQNARVYRSIFDSLGDTVVLEHHSNLDPARETTTNRLQAENWDAPLVVTTNVQFFESLFACRTSRCRKLHRIARRVIILDEVQSLPVELLTPTLLAIRELVESYGCTVVLCTATQPALNWKDEFPIGLHEITPIIDAPNLLHQRLKRTTVHLAGKMPNDELVRRIDANNQVLCIVNTRPHATEVFSALSDDRGTYHLSTRMCAAHRLQVLERKIRPRLQAGKRCRVISTQLIEAGVDVDFPVVYRAICGLDSLTQAAGRCNREGRLAQGNVYLFESEQPPPAGMLRQAADSGRELLDKFDDLLSPEAVEAYFRLHYWKRKDTWDKYQVMEAVGRSPNAMQFQFRQIAERYRFIVEESESVIVPWGKGKRLIAKLENPNRPPTRDDWRMLQRYTVSVRDHELRQLSEAGALVKLHERWVLSQSHLYDEYLGLNLQKADGVLPADDLIC